MFAFILLSGCALSQFFLRNNKYYLFYIKKTEHKVASSTDEADRPILGTQGTNSVLEEKLTLSKYMAQAKKSISMTDGLLLALMYVFILTFICYPGLLMDSKLGFMSGIKNYGSWFSLFIQAVFNAFDAVGRYMGGVYCLILSNRTIKVFTIMRTLFLVTCLLISFDVAPSALFSSDWFILINLILFSLSNGYVSTLCAVKAPMTVEGEAKGQVGGFIGITISTGIVIGSLLAFGMVYVIKASPEYQSAA